MKLTDKLSEWCGMDKIAHFGVGGLIAAVILILMAWQDAGHISVWRMAHMSWAGVVVVAVLGFLKEACLDDQRDWKDFAAGVIGAGVIVLAAYSGAVLNVLSR